MNRVKIITLLVKDYDEAIEFYTRKLGFELIEDKTFGPGRWVTLSLPANRETALALELATDESDQSLVGRQAGSFPLLAIDTLDCLADFERLKSNDVKTHGEPQSGPWGTGVMVEDLYGNKFFLSQEPQHNLA